MRAGASHEIPLGDIVRRAIEATNEPDPERIQPRPPHFLADTVASSTKRAAQEKLFAATLGTTTKSTQKLSGTASGGLGGSGAPGRSGPERAVGCDASPAEKQELGDAGASGRARTVRDENPKAVYVDPSRARVEKQAAARIASFGTYKKFQEDTSTPLLVEPSVVHFTKYSPENAYKATFTLKNVGKTSRRYSLIPPDPPFSVTYLAGSLQPGQTQAVDVLFKPPSRGTYSSVCVVRGKDFAQEVRLEAKNEPPRLVLRSVLADGAEPKAAVIKQTTISPTHQLIDVNVGAMVRQDALHSVQLYIQNKASMPYNAFASTHKMPATSSYVDPPSTVTLDCPAHLTCIELSNTAKADSECRMNIWVNKESCYNCTFPSEPPEAAADFWDSPSRRLAGQRVAKGSRLAGMSIPSLSGFRKSGRTIGLYTGTADDMEGLPAEGFGSGALDDSAARASRPVPRSGGDAGEAGDGESSLVCSMEPNGVLSIELEFGNYLLAEDQHVVHIVSEEGTVLDVLVRGYSVAGHIQVTHVAGRELQLKPTVIADDEIIPRISAVQKAREENQKHLRVLSARGTMHYSAFGDEGFDEDHGRLYTLPPDKVIPVDFQVSPDAPSPVLTATLSVGFGVSGVLPRDVQLVLHRCRADLTMGAVPRTYDDLMYTENVFSLSASNFDDGTPVVVENYRRSVDIVADLQRLYNPNNNAKNTLENMRYQFRPEYHAILDLMVSEVTILRFLLRCNVTLMSEAAKALEAVNGVDGMLLRTPKQSSDDFLLIYEPSIDLGILPASCKTDFSFTVKNCSETVYFPFVVGMTIRSPSLSLTSTLKDQGVLFQMEQHATLEQPAGEGESGGQGRGDVQEVGGMTGAAGVAGLAGVGGAGGAAGASRPARASRDSRDLRESRGSGGPEASGALGDAAGLRASGSPGTAGVSGTSALQRAQLLQQAHPAQGESAGGKLDSHLIGTMIPAVQDALHRQMPYKGPCSRGITTIVSALESPAASILEAEAQDAAEGGPAHGAQGAHGAHAGQAGQKAQEQIGRSGGRRGGSGGARADGHAENRERGAKASERRPPAGGAPTGPAGSLATQQTFLSLFSLPALEKAPASQPAPKISTTTPDNIYSSLVIPFPNVCDVFAQARLMVHQASQATTDFGGVLSICPSYGIIPPGAEMVVHVTMTPLAAGFLEAFALVHTPRSAYYSEVVGKILCKMDDQRRRMLQYQELVDERVLQTSYISQLHRTLPARFHYLADRAADAAGRVPGRSPHRAAGYRISTATSATGSAAASVAVSTAISPAASATASRRATRLGDRMGRRAAGGPYSESARSSQNSGIADDSGAPASFSGFQGHENSSSSARAFDHAPAVSVAPFPGISSGISSAASSVASLADASAVKGGVVTQHPLARGMEAIADAQVLSDRGSASYSVEGEQAFLQDPQRNCADTDFQGFQPGIPTGSPRDSLHHSPHHSSPSSPSHPHQFPPTEGPEPEEGFARVFGGTSAGASMAVLESAYPQGNQQGLFGSDDSGKFVGGPELPAASCRVHGVVTTPSVEFLDKEVTPGCSQTGPSDIRLQNSGLIDTFVTVVTLKGDALLLDEPALRELLRQFELPCDELSSLPHQYLVRCARKEVEVFLRAGEERTLRALPGLGEPSIIVARKSVGAFGLSVGEGGRKVYDEEFVTADGQLVLSAMTLHPRVNPPKPYIYFEAAPNRKFGILSPEQKNLPDIHMRGRPYNPLLVRFVIVNPGLSEFVAEIAVGFDVVAPSAVAVPPHSKARASFAVNPDRSGLVETFINFHDCATRLVIASSGPDIILSCPHIRRAEGLVEYQGMTTFGSGGSRKGPSVSGTARWMGSGDAQDPSAGYLSARGVAGPGGDAMDALDAMTVGGPGGFGATKTVSLARGAKAGKSSREAGDTRDSRDGRSTRDTRNARTGGVAGSSTARDLQTQNRSRKGTAGFLQEDNNASILDGADGESNSGVALWEKYATTVPLDIVVSSLGPEELMERGVDNGSGNIELQTGNVAEFVSVLRRKNPDARGVLDMSAALSAKGDLKKELLQKLPYISFSASSSAGAREGSAAAALAAGSASGPTTGSTTASKRVPGSARPILTRPTVKVPGRGTQNGQAAPLGGKTDTMLTAMRAARGTASLPAPPPVKLPGAVSVRVYNPTGGEMVVEPVVYELDERVIHLAYEEDEGRVRLVFGGPFFRAPLAGSGQALEWRRPSSIGDMPSLREPGTSSQGRPQGAGAGSPHRHSEEGMAAKELSYTPHEPQKLQGTSGAFLVSPKSASIPSRGSTMFSIVPSPQLIQSCKKYEAILEIKGLFVKLVYEIPRPSVKLCDGAQILEFTGSYNSDSRYDLSLLNESPTAPIRVGLEVESPFSLGDGEASTFTLAGGEQRGISLMLPAAALLSSTGQAVRTPSARTIDGILSGERRSVTIERRLTIWYPDYSSRQDQEDASGSSGSSGPLGCSSHSGSSALPGDRAGESGAAQEGGASLRSESTGRGEPIGSESDSDSDGNDPVEGLGTSHGASKAPHPSSSSQPAQSSQPLRPSLPRLPLTSSSASSLSARRHNAAFTRTTVLCTVVAPTLIPAYSRRVFEPVFLSESVEARIHLTNPTNCDCNWNIVHVPLQDAIAVSLQRKVEIPPFLELSPATSAFSGLQVRASAEETFGRDSSALSSVFYDSIDRSLVVDNPGAFSFDSVSGVVPASGGERPFKSVGLNIRVEPAKGFVRSSCTRDGEYPVVFTGVYYVRVSGGQGCWIVLRGSVEENLDAV